MHVLLHHESDLFIKGSGKTFASALLSVVDGAIAYINRGRACRGTKRFSVSQKGKEDLETAFALLDAFNAFIDSEGVMPCKAISVKKEKGRLRLVFSGKRSRFSSPIKALTHHDFKAKKSKSGWEIEALFDI
jgi:SHS2 domain-containing protein